MSVGSQVRRVEALETIGYRLFKMEQAEKRKVNPDKDYIKALERAYSTVYKLRTAITGGPPLSRLR